MPTTLEQANDLRKSITAAEETLRNYKARLAALEQQCPHSWTEPVYNPIIIPGGYDPGDPPGTMGVDRQLPCSWPETRKDRWRRTCKICGKVEHTERVNETTVKTPRF